MPDESFKTYQEVMDYLRAKRGRKIDLLFGNGFSMAYDPNIFSYNALGKFVKSCNDPVMLKLFSIVGIKKSGKYPCDFNFPDGLFEREAFVNCGRSMLRRFQKDGETLEDEIVSDRLLMPF